MRRVWPVIVLMAGLVPRTWAQGASGPPSSASVRVFGYIQPRFQSDGDSASFFLRRVRFGAQGAAAAWASFRVQAELRTGGDTGTAAATVEMTDAWVAAANVHWVATAGQFKTPFSREQLQSASTLELAERTLVETAVAPARDVGAMVEWHTLPGARQVVHVAGGAFNGEGANRATNPDGRMLYVARLSAGTRAVEIAGNVANDNHGTRWGADGQVLRGAWIFRGEVLSFDHEPAAAGRDRGWYLLGGYTMLQRHLQLAARVEAFTVDAPAPETIHGYSVGWQYFFRGDDLKIQAAYTLFDEQGALALDNRLIVQAQARF